MATVDTVSRIVNTMLAPAFRAALHIVPRRSMKPILAGVRLAAGPDGITVSATDLEIGFIARLPSNPDGAECATVIPRAAVESWAKAIVETIDVDDRAASANGARVPTEDANEFPAVAVPPNPSAVRLIPFAKLSAIAAHIGGAADVDSSRYALGGVLVESGDACVRFVGTDGRRLHVFRLAGASDGAFHHVIPIAALSAAVKAIDKSLSRERGAEKKKAIARTFVRMDVDDFKGIGSFRWSVGNCEFMVSWRAIQGRFPRYRDCFPEWLETVGANSAGDVEVADMLSHAETCRKTICSDNSKGIDIFRDAGDAGPSVSARSAERGEYRKPLRGFIANGWKRKLDPAFVADVMRAAAAFGDAATSPNAGAENVDVYGESDGGAAVFFGRPGDVFRKFPEAAASPDAFAAVVMPLAAD